MALPAWLRASLAGVGVGGVTATGVAAVAGLVCDGCIGGVCALKRTTMALHVVVLAPARLPLAAIRSMAVPVWLLRLDAQMVLAVLLLVRVLVMVAGDDACR